MGGANASCFLLTLILQGWGHLDKGEPPPPGKAV